MAVKAGKGNSTFDQEMQKIANAQQGIQTAENDLDPVVMAEDLAQLLEASDMDEQGELNPVTPKPLPNYDGDQVGKKKATDLRKYSWFITINNPEKIFPGKTPEQMLDLVGNALAGRSRGCMANFERGLKENTNHIHAVVEADNAIRASTLEKCFPCKDEHGKQRKIEVEVYDGTKKDKDGKRITKMVEKPLYWLFWHAPTESDYQSLLAYMTKTGRHASKEETVIIPPKEFGSRKIIGFVGSGKGKNGDFDLNQIYALFKRGVRPQDIYEADQNWRYQANQIEKMYADYVERFGDTRWEMDVAWLIGASGTRKTSYIEKAQEEYGRSDVYMVDNYAHPFDYYTGQRCLFLDEFRGEKVPFSTFLTWTIGFRGRVDARYSDHAKEWRHIYITSVLMPEECYPNRMDDKDNIAQLKRRVTRYIYFFRTKDGAYHYKEFPATLSTTQEHMQDAILDEYPEAVFQAFTEDTWEEFLANGGLADFQLLVEKRREIKRRMNRSNLVTKEDVAEMIAQSNTQDQSYSRPAPNPDCLFDEDDEEPY